MQFAGIDQEERPCVSRMYLCAVGGTWFFGIRLGWMVTGAYVGLALDECVRAVCMLLRWQSGRWQQKSLIKQAPERGSDELSIKTAGS